MNLQTQLSMEQVVAQPEFPDLITIADNHHLYKASLMEQQFKEGKVLSEVRPFISSVSGVMYTIQRYYTVDPNTNQALAFYLPFIYQNDSMNSELYYIDYHSLVDVPGRASIIKILAGEGNSPTYTIFPPLVLVPDINYELPGMLELSKATFHVVVKQDCGLMLGGMEIGAAQNLKKFAVVTADKLVSTRGDTLLIRDAAYVSDVFIRDFENVPEKLKLKLGVRLKKIPDIGQEGASTWDRIKDNFLSKGAIQVKAIETNKISASLISGGGCLKYMDDLFRAPPPPENVTPQNNQTAPVNNYQSAPDFNSVSLPEAVDLGDDVTSRIIQFLKVEKCNNTHSSAESRLASAIVKLNIEFGQQLKTDDYFTISTCCFGQAPEYLKGEMGPIGPGGYNLKLAMKKGDMAKILYNDPISTEVNALGRNKLLVYSVFSYIASRIMQIINKSGVQSESKLSIVTQEILNSLPRSNYVSSADASVSTTNEQQSIGGMIAYVKPTTHQSNQKYIVSSLMEKKNELTGLTTEESAGQQSSYESLLDLIKVPYAKPTKYSFPAELNALKEVTNVNIVGDGAVETWTEVDDKQRPMIKHRAAAPPRADVALLTRTIVANQTIFEPTENGTHENNNDGDGSDDGEMSNEESRFDDYDGY